MNTYEGLGRDSIPSILSYPFNFAEIKLANDARLDENSKIQYKGMSDLFRKTLLNDGISGFYRGVKIKLLGLVGYNLIRWSLIGLMRSFDLTTDFGVSQCLVDFFAYSLMYPLTVLKSRVIVGHKKHDAISIWKLFTNVIKSQGITGLFGGYIFVLIYFIGTLFCSTLFEKFS